MDSKQGSVHGFEVWSWMDSEQGLSGGLFDGVEARAFLMDPIQWQLHGYELYNLEGFEERTS